ncbi:MAG TPA: hypothetical protein VFN74_08535 [Chloroflexota bacterium]|nr:hypothetical protein [Chloroflexota bacterium]
MRYGELTVASKDNPLSPPPSQTELRWWRARRGALFRRTFLRFGLPMGLIPILTTLVARPERLLTPSMFFVTGLAIAVALGGTWMHAKLVEKDYREQEIRWKRIREALVGDDGAVNVPPEQPPSLPADTPR